MKQEMMMRPSRKLTPFAQAAINTVRRVGGGGASGSNEDAAGASL